MIDAEKIKDAIEKLYTPTNGPNVDIPLALRAMQLAEFAKEYIAAASIVEREAPQYWLPRLQLTGHAIELALKACIASANSDPPVEHDLIELYRQAEKLGFELDEAGFAAIVHLRHFYYQDLATGTKHKARYPTKQDERLGGAVPSNSTFISVVNSLVEQAAQTKQ
jgi:hypothetical protein